MESRIIQKSYTDQAYWEKYYNSTNIDTQRIKNIVGAYDNFWELFIKACKHKPTSIIEIGAFPGRYLAYLANRYQLRPTALDYNSDTKKIEDCFKAFGVDDYDCIQADFTSYITKTQYDLVMSNGFIEHFENYEQILDKHIEYLAPGGSLFIMIPNKRFLRKWYSYLVDYKNLKVHNLKVMNLNVFRNFAKRNDLDIKYLDYHGGFPFSVHQKLNPVQNFIFKTFRFTFRYLNPIISKHPNKYMSSTIIAIYTKKHNP